MYTLLLLIFSMLAHNHNEINYNFINVHYSVNLGELSIMSNRIQWFAFFRSFFKLIVFISMCSRLLHSKSHSISSYIPMVKCSLAAGCKMLLFIVQFEFVISIFQLNHFHLLPPVPSRTFLYNYRMDENVPWWEKDSFYCSIVIAKVLKFSFILRFIIKYVLCMSKIWKL